MNLSLIQMSVTAWSLVQTWVLLLSLWPMEWLLQSCSYSVETKTYSRFVSWGCASRLIVDHRLMQFMVLLCCLQHCQISGVRSIFKGSDNRLLNSKFLDWIRRVGCQSQLRNLRRVSVLRIWIIGDRGFLRAKLVIALDYNRSELKSILVWSLNIDQQSWASTVIDARFIIRSSLSLLCGTATGMVMEHLKACLACSRLFPIAYTLFGGRIRCRTT